MAQAGILRQTTQDILKYGDIAAVVVLLGRRHHHTATLENNRATIVIVHPCEYTKQCRLANTIAPHQAHLLTIIHTKFHIRHQRLRPKRLLGNGNIGNHRGYYSMAKYILCG